MLAAAAPTYARIAKRYNEAMVITLTGNEFSIKQTLQTLAERFVAKFGPNGYERIDGEAFEAQGLASLLQGASLFTPQRLVVIRDAAKNKNLWESLGDWVGKVPADTTLVVIEPVIDKRTKTYKLLKNGSDFKEFAVPHDAELVRWLQAEVKSLGAELNPDDAQYLVDRVGRDQWALFQEVQKLASHKVINTKLINELVAPNPEGSAFELLDAALAGRVDRVQQLVASLKYQEDPYKLFGLLASQVHALAVVVAAGGKSADQVAGDAGLHPFVVRKTQAVAQKLGKDRIKQIIVDVAACDMQLKTTGADPWQLLSILLQRLAT